MTPNRVTPRQSRTMPLRRAERSPPPLGSVSSATLAPVERRAVPEAQVRRAAAQQLEAEVGREGARVGPVTLGVAAVGQVQDQQVASRPGDAGHLAELGPGEVRAAGLVEVGERVDGDHGVEGAVPEYGEV